MPHKVMLSKPPEPNALRDRLAEFGKNVKVWHCLALGEDQYPCGGGRQNGHGATSVLDDVTCIACCKAVIENQREILNRLRRIAGGEDV